MSTDYLDDIISDRSGLIWIATHGSGVDVHDPRRSAFTIYQHDPQIAASLASNNVWTVSEDRHGALWVGTQDQGSIASIRKADRLFITRLIRTTRSGWATNGSRHWSRIRAARSGSAHTAVDSTVSTRRVGTSRSTGTMARPRAASVMTRLPTSIWIVPAPFGLALVAAVSTVSIRRATRSRRTGTIQPILELSSDWVWAIAEDARGNLWIGTLGGGLNRLELATDRFTRFRRGPKETGLPQR